MSIEHLPRATIESVQTARRRWCVTGGAGFIGSHIIEALLELGQDVICLDDFSTGKQKNLDMVRSQVGEDTWAQFELLKGDIREPEACAQACASADFVLHLAAQGSVVLSMENPALTHDINVQGTAQMLGAAHAAGVRRFVYSSSSAVYGNETTVPAVEDKTGTPLSPYAASKVIGEILANNWSRSVGLSTVGLRYFNVVGSRQDPNGAYAAVIPRWIDELRSGLRPTINGDGETTRDFCPVADIVHANLAAAFAELPESADPGLAPSLVCNIALGSATSLNELFSLLRDGVSERGGNCNQLEPNYGPFREGDIRHSTANIQRAQKGINYAPAMGLSAGLAETLDWFLR
ncbi:MAG: NAD-dependent epimerase/dehydratase family protein [Planctomycetota bacterium]|jgi:UDP-N-acetylglucosamine 4-epimerase|nr:NAD-dependent epimerase/dehydratase family protein [Planctomycetota bacterium]MDP6941330.1 NAD-dependent epimerase/dehydratase family protein [Planctomycetota bacterium]